MKMESAMRHMHSIAFAAGLCMTVAAGGALASPMLSVSNIPETLTLGDANTMSEHVVRVQKTESNSVPIWAKRAYPRYQYPRRNHGVYLDRRSPGYYSRHNPYYDEPYPHQYYSNDPDPYYDRPRSGRYSCGEIIRMLRNRGFHRIQPYDCKGKVYSFFAYAGHKKYKLRVRSKNGSIKTQKRL